MVSDRIQPKLIIHGGAGSSLKEKAEPKQFDSRSIR